MEQNPLPSQRPFIAAGLLFSLTMALYYGSVLEILFTQKTINIDDTKLISGLINSPMAFEDIFKTYGHYYRPFINFSFWLDQTLWGVNAFSFRLTNLLIHAANVLLLHSVCRAFYRGERLRESTAFLAALIFAVHPIGVESTSWISGRTDLLATFWSLASILLYFSGRERREKIKLFFALLLLIPAILSKESAYATLLLFMTLEGARYFHSARGKARKLLLILSLPVGSAIIYMLLRASGILKVEISSHIFKALSSPDLLSQATLSFATIFFYLKKFLYPFPLVFYISEISTNIYAFTALILTFTAAFFLRSVTKKEITLIAWALLGLLPSVYVAVAGPAWSYWAERYLYYSLAPLSILFAASLATLIHQVERVKKTFVKTAAVIIVILLSITTVKRSFLWNDNTLFWKNELLKNSHSAAIYLQYGASLLSEKRYDEAEKTLKRGLDYRGMSHLIYLNLGKIERVRANYQAAETYFQKALKEAESDPKLLLNKENLTGQIHSSLGRLFLKRGNLSGQAESVNKVFLKQAAESFINAFNSDTSRIYDLRRAAKIFIRIGEKRMASETLKRFISRNPPGHYKKWAINKIAEIK